MRILREFLVRIHGEFIEHSRAFIDNSENSRELTGFIETLREFNDNSPELKDNSRDVIDNSQNMHENSQRIH